MTNEEKIKEEIYDKLLMEHDSFIEQLKGLSPIEIIDKSYEKVIKDEFLIMFEPENNKYDINDINALNKTKNPLEELYHGWMSSDGGIGQILDDNVRDTLETLRKDQRNKSMER